MKKMLLSVFALSVALVACNESEAKQETAAPAAQPAVAQAPAAPAPEAKPAAENRMAHVKTVDWAKADEMAKAGAMYLDVRYPDELMKGYVPNAKNIPINELLPRMGELPKDKDILIYCRSGRRSEAATNLLMKNGFERVYNVAGGFLAYPQQN
ncbi:MULTISPECIES: rhodanese-like domain-containing protein [unclassified Fibrobacter]|uniref:rhodanese-like domain-containing protein n=1 Tax=unclassified Fibrobacter TaxID=2634177 RepID=UPI000D7B6D24|nr:MULTISPECIES: rhodanese-like domain-containing protein [unclassified Fibrobacter]PWJ71863.1 rhodanese-related sulfurtransferase [Fibrobacter sp. UWR4]PZW73778.1 rhodanese-related sulfurtransferase [Fibrobacter sp. UWR1]